MENKHCSIAPYHDPTDDPSSADQILMFNNESPSLGLADFPEIAEPSSNNPLLFPQSQPQGVGTNNILDPNDPLYDPFIWEVFNGESDGGNVAAGNCEAGSSGIHGERIIGQGNNSSDFSGAVPPQTSSGFGNPVQLPVWPVPPSPYNCSCCHILREIIHINGIHVSNLEIHGRLGIISHAVLDRYEMDLSTGNHQYQMFDFCKESIDSVKNFLVQYCREREREGYAMIQDPLSVFYEALCVGLNEKENHNDQFLQPPSVFSGVPQADIGKMNQQDIANLEKPENYGSGLATNDRQEILTQDEGDEGGRQPSKSSLATQRERTGKMKLKDFSEYFHLPITAAAKKLKVCPTVIKKKCRQGGLSRWPYRKIKGIKRKISMKQQSLTTATDEEKPHVLAEIQALEQELENIFAEFS